MKYDEALFLQKVSKAIKETDGVRYVRESDVEKAFWEVSWDLDLALHQQRPDKVEEAREFFREKFLRELSDQVEDQLDVHVLEDI